MEGEPVWEISWELSQCVLGLQAVGTEGREHLDLPPTFSFCFSSKATGRLVAWLSLGHGPALSCHEYLS